VTIVAPLKTTVLVLLRTAKALPALTALAQQHQEHLVVSEDLGLAASLLRPTLRWQDAEAGAHLTHVVIGE